MTEDIASTPPHAAEQQSDPWRKHRIWAGVLTVFLGLVSAIFWLAFAQQMSFLSGVMSGRGPSGVSVPFPVVAIVLSMVIGGLMFCGTQGWGRPMVWLAAVTTPLLVIMAGNYGWFGLILLAISAYLIWVLRKTKPAKKGLRLAASRLAIGLVIVLLMIFGDGILFQYNKKYWEPTEHLAGLRIGMSREEVLGRKGQPDECWRDASSKTSTCSWHLTSRTRPDFVVEYDRNHVSSIAVSNPRKTGDKIPFETVEQMREILGEEDILAMGSRGPRIAGGSPELGYTKHTYQDWEVTYEFRYDHFVGVSIGEQWGHSPKGDYFIQGSQVCPGTACPWDDEGDLKKEYEKGSYRDFLTPDPALEEKLAEREASKERYAAAKQAAEQAQQAAREQCQAGKELLLGKWEIDNPPNHYVEYGQERALYYSDDSGWRSKGDWSFTCKDSRGRVCGQSCEGPVRAEVGERIQTCSKCAPTGIEYTLTFPDPNTFVRTSKYETVNGIRVVNREE
jgi:hypothetical protein